MKVKKYTGETIQDVIFQVKADLGPEAVIINKRKFKKGGIFGFFGKTMFEIVAALENKNSAEKTAQEEQSDDRIEISSFDKVSSRDLERKNIEKTASPDPENKNAIKEFITGLKESHDNQTTANGETEKISESETYNKTAKKIERVSNKNDNKNDSEFRDELQRLQNNKKKNSEMRVSQKNKVKNSSSDKNEDQNLTAEQKLQNKFEKKGVKNKNKNLNNSNQLYNYLLDQGVDSRNLNRFLKKMNNEINFDSDTEFKKQLKNFFKLYFIENNGIEIDSRQKIITFIGPTGVGKTTTMAKIAAHFAVDEDKSVGLITADTYRIAAVEQLQTYSNIIDIPFAVCYSSSKLKEMLEGQFRDCDLVLIDTPGSSWKDQQQLGRLKDYTDKEFVDEVHLLLSLNTKSSDLRSVVSKFSKLNPDRVLLTKLDETNSYGDIINIKENYELPLSYLTVGQDVPEDLEIANPENIYQYLFGDFYA